MNFRVNRSAARVHLTHQPRRPFGIFSNLLDGYLARNSHRFVRIKMCTISHNFVFHIWISRYHKKKKKTMGDVDGGGKYGGKGCVNVDFLL